MRSKLTAARVAAQFGVPTIIASGRRAGTLRDLSRGVSTGTLVLPAASRLNARKHWIAHTLKPMGNLVVDAGAVRALLDQKKSLLPAGVTRVEGDFEVGDLVRVLGPDGNEVARGLVSYAARELDRLRGKATTEIEAVLGYRTDDEAIHREDLVLVE
jgi:glutamate 5-kinase